MDASLGAICSWATCYMKLEMTVLRAHLHKNLIVLPLQLKALKNKGKGPSKEKKYGIREHGSNTQWYNS